MSVQPIKAEVMAAIMNDPAAAGIPGTLLQRGYSAVYRQGEVNRCPGCGRSHWYVGRSSAECAFCATAIPLLGC